jgi:C-terminal processing protease CtpA/Prc
MFLRPVLLSILAFSLVFAKPAPASTALEALRSRVRDDACTVDADHFSACLEGLAFLFDRTTGLTLAPKDYDWREYSKIDRVHVEVVEELGDLKLIRLGLEAKTGKITRARQGSIVAHDRKIKAAWADLYSRTSGHVAVEALLERALEGLSPAETEALAADTLTVYESGLLHDGHVKLESITAMAMNLGQTSKDLEGVGIAYAAEADGLRIQSTVAGGPAEGAGLRRGDFVRQVDGKSVAGAGGLSAFEALIPGDAGTLVKLSLLRGKHMLDFMLERKAYRVDFTKSRLVKSGGVPVGLVRLRSFNYPGACDDVKYAVLDLKSQGARSFVLDLRDNGGGDVGQAECIAGIFLDFRNSKNILYRRRELGREGFSDELPRNPDPVFVEDLEDMHSDPFAIGMGNSGAPTTPRALPPSPSPSRFPISEPLTILLNENSASASELLAGGLRDRMRAVLVGERSFGKGCGQHAEEFDNSESLKLYRTMFYFLRPLGSSVQRVGIDPDIRVRLPGDQGRKFREKDRVPESPAPLSDPTAPGTPPWPGLHALKGCAKQAIDLETSDASDRQLTAALDIARCEVVRNSK